MSAGAGMDAHDGSPTANAQHQRKRKRHRHKDNNPDWDEEAGVIEVDEDNRPGRLTLVAGLLLLAAIMGVVIFAMRIDETHSPEIAVDVPEFEETVPSDSTPVEEEDATPSSSRRTITQFVNEARTTATIFLNATTVDELLEIVARPELMGDRIRQHYPDGVIEAPGLANYSQFTQLETTEAYVIVQLHTANHLARQMAFLEGVDGLKVDWESWVGWAELPMEEFISQRPSGPHQFRVRLGAIDYYNFYFSDDRKWQSFRLVSPDREHSLFGYAERGTPVHIRVREALDAGIEKILVEVEFTDNEDPTGRQVMITNVLSNNWIHPDRISHP